MPRLAILTFVINLLQAASSDCYRSVSERNVNTATNCTNIPDQNVQLSPENLNSFSDENGIALKNTTVDNNDENYIKDDNYYEGRTRIRRRRNRKINGKISNAVLKEKYNATDDGQSSRKKYSTRVYLKNPTKFSADSENYNDHQPTRRRINIQRENNKPKYENSEAKYQRVADPRVDTEELNETTKSQAVNDLKPVLTSTPKRYLLPPYLEQNVFKNVDSKNRGNTKFKHTFDPDEVFDDSSYPINDILKTNDLLQNGENYESAQTGDESNSISYRENNRTNSFKNQRDPYENYEIYRQSAGYTDQKKQYEPNNENSTTDNQNVHNSQLRRAQQNFYSDSQNRQNGPSKQQHSTNNLADVYSDAMRNNQKISFNQNQEHFINPTNAYNDAQLNNPTNIYRNNQSTGSTVGYPYYKENEKSDQRHFFNDNQPPDSSTPRYPYYKQQNSETYHKGLTYNNQPNVRDNKESIALHNQQPLNYSIEQQFPHYKQGISQQNNVYHQSQNVNNQQKTNIADRESASSNDQYRPENAIHPNYQQKPQNSYSSDGRNNLQSRNTTNDIFDKNHKSKFPDNKPQIYTSNYKKDQNFYDNTNQKNIVNDRPNNNYERENSFKTPDEIYETQETFYRPYDRIESTSKRIIDNGYYHQPQTTVSVFPVSTTQKSVTKVLLHYALHFRNNNLSADANSPSTYDNKHFDHDKAYRNKYYNEKQNQVKENNLANVFQEILPPSIPHSKAQDTKQDEIYDDDSNPPFPQEEDELTKEIQFYFANVAKNGVLTTSTPRNVALTVTNKQPTTRNVALTVKKNKPATRDNVAVTGVPATSSVKITASPAQRRTTPPPKESTTFGLDIAESKYFDDLPSKDELLFQQNDDDQIIPGVAGRDYPTYSTPAILGMRFPCRGVDGYFADRSTKCQVFYICNGDGAGEPMLCPNGTVFSQDLLVCDWWYNVEC